MFVAVSGYLVLERLFGAVGKVTVTMADALAKIPDVEIDPEGTFKYILLRVNAKGGDVNKEVVRGTKSAEYHSKWTGTEGAQNASLLLRRGKKTPNHEVERLQAVNPVGPSSLQML